MWHPRATPAATPRPCAGPARPLVEAEAGCPHEEDPLGARCYRRDPRRGARRVLVLSLWPRPAVPSRAAARGWSGCGAGHGGGGAACRWAGLGGFPVRSAQRGSQWQAAHPRKWSRAQPDTAVPFLAWLPQLVQPQPPAMGSPHTRGRGPNRGQAARGPPDPRGVARLRQRRAHIPRQAGMGAQGWQPEQGRLRRVWRKQLIEPTRGWGGVLLGLGASNKSWRAHCAVQPDGAKALQVRNIIFVGADEHSARVWKHDRQVVCIFWQLHEVQNIWVLSFCASLFLNWEIFEKGHRGQIRYQ